MEHDGVVRCGVVLSATGIGHEHLVAFLEEDTLIRCSCG